MSPRWLHWPAAVVGGTFVPTDISGCIGWFDADDSATITTATGVSNWADKSGSAPADYSQPTAGSQPTVTTAGLNGRDVITFDGVDDECDGLVPYPVPNASIFVVLSSTDTSWILFSRTTTCYMPVAQSGSGSTTISSAFGSPTYYVDGATPSPFATRNDVYTALTAGPCIFEAINCSLTSLTTTLAATHKLCGYGGFEFAGDIAEIVMYDTALAQSDRETVEGYLAHKWGLTASLPVSHPYKTVAP